MNGKSKNFLAIMQGFVLLETGCFASETTESRSQRENCQTEKIENIYLSVGT